MIFVDSNVPMYLIGAAHPHKVRQQVARILTFDSGFDAVQGIERLIS